MIGILLITHGSFGEALVQNACHVLNKRPPQLNQLGVSAQDDPLDLLPLARQMLKLVDSGKGVLVLTDIFGAVAGQSGLEIARTRPRRRPDRGQSAHAAARADLSRQGHGNLLMRARDGGRDGVFNMLDH
jgi:PTS system mannose-specific IIA component